MMYLVNDLPDIVEVLRHYGANVSRTTGQVNVKCPFHDDTHRSAAFNSSKNIFNCLACGMNGNSLQIIAKKEGVSINEAKSFAERITGTGNSQVRNKYFSGRRLPSKQGNNKGSGTTGSIRRSLGA